MSKQERSRALRYLMLSALAGVLLSGTTVADVGNKEFTACSLILPPHSMPDKNNQPDGFASHVLEAVSQQLHWTVHVQYMPWLRVVQASKDGECDIAYTVLKRDDYETFLTFPDEPIHTRQNLFISLKKNKIDYNGDLESFMRRYRIGMYRDKAVNTDFERLRKQPWVNIESVNTPDQNFKKLLEGRVDAVIENNYTATYLLRNLDQLSQVSFHLPPLSITPAYFTFPKKGRVTAQEIEAFNTALRRFKETLLYVSWKDYYEGKENGMTQ